MAVHTPSRSYRTYRTVPQPERRIPKRTQRRPRAPREWPMLLLTGLLALGFAITIGLAILAESSGSLAAPGGWLTFGGRLTGLAGTYLMLVVIFLVARVSWFERVIGQDRLVAFHRRLGPWPIVLILAHAVLITFGYAARAEIGFWAEAWDLTVSYPGVLMAVVATGLIVLAGVTSYRIARRRMRYETWWLVHLYTYLALALSFPHQIATGASFVGQPVNQAWWIAIWTLAVGAVLWFRILVPLGRSTRHQLRVVSVTPEAPGVVSLVVSGRRLDRLAVAGGQFFQWRFLARGLWWNAHPYSLSAMPQPPYLRVTIKDLGDQSGLMRSIRPGTRIAIEGPYGAFTRFAATGDRLLLVGAGVGVTPIRTLLEDLPLGRDISVVLRGRDIEDLPHVEEMRTLAEARGARLYFIGGSREESPVATTLPEVVPDLAERDIYVCGPTSFTEDVVRTARRHGVGAERIHFEEFAF